MKGHLRFCLLLTLSLPLSLVNAQFGYNSPTPSERQENRAAWEKNWDANRTAGIESITVQSLGYKKGEPVDEFKTSIKNSFNQKGQEVKKEIHNHKGSLSRTLLFEWDGNGNLIGETFAGKHGKVINKDEYEYVDGKMSLERVYSGKKPAPVFRREFGYDETEKLIESNRYKCRTNSLLQSWKYSYYDDGSKKRT
jgi:hypothetical protein